MHILHTHSLEGFLALIATLVHAIWLAIPARFAHIGTFSPLIPWPPPCIHLTKLPPSSLHTTRMAPSPPSLVELPANGSHEKPIATPTPRIPHRFLSGGGDTCPGNHNTPGVILVKGGQVGLLFCSHKIPQHVYHKLSATLPFPLY